MSDRGVEDVDLLVIGGGKAGKSLAMDRAKAGSNVAMVERDKIGGTCTARFIAPRTVEVETRDETIRLLRGTDVVINTG